MPTSQAQEMARRQNLDLVEVAPNVVPPVCRLLDYGKYKYRQTKKEHQARKSQKTSLLRQIRLRPKIGDHDFEAKARTARKLLAEGDKVKVTIIFRGREITHPQLGFKLLQRMTEILSDAGSVERQPVLEQRQMNIIMAPAATAKPTTKPKPKEAAKKEEKKEEAKKEA